MLYTKSKDFMKNMIKNLDMSMNVCTFVVLQDDDCIRYAGQAVNLLNLVIGHFLCPKVKYWRLPIRKIHICSRSEYNHLVAAYMATAFLLPFLNHFKCYKMESLVFNGENGQVLTNSLLVAEKFGKDHKHVLFSIRELIKGLAQNLADLMFVESTYTNQQNGQDYPMFVMNRDGFTLLAMGFTGTKALQFKMEFLDAFKKMESLLNSDDYILMRSQQILQKRVEAAEQRVKALEADNASKEETISIQAEKIKESAPKVKIYNEYISSTGTYTATQLAKEYGWGAETLNRKLKEMGIQYKQNGQWLLYSRYDGKNYTKSIPRTYTKSDGTIGTQMQTVWTSQGREFIHSLFKM